jgi:hypothetical protein
MFRVPAKGHRSEATPEPTPLTRRPRPTHPTTNPSGLASQPYGSAPGAWAETPRNAPDTFVPVSSEAQTSKGRTKAETIFATERKSDEAVDDSEFPGPFIDRSGLLYPWLHPTWMCWIGLAFMTELTACVVAGTTFFFLVAMSFGAFVSLFTFASMVVVCVGLSAYLATTFVMILEGTANGDNRLHRLPGYVRYEILGPFFRVVGADLCAIGVACSVTYVCRDWLGPWYDPRAFIVNELISFVLFPIFMITNSADQSFLPIGSLFATLRRLAFRAGHFLLFIVVSGVAWIAINAAIIALLLWHIAAGLAVAGALLATWIMYYGHWMGRLTREIAAVD